MLSRAFSTILLLVGGAASAAAQSGSVTDYKQGTIGFQRSGTQQFIGAQNATSKAMAPIGYIDTVSGKFVSAPGRFEIKGVSPLDLTLAGTKNPNAIMFGAGNQVSFCPALSCINGPPDGSINPAFYDHQRASLLVAAETQDDMHSEEQTVGITTTVSKGLLKPYTASTAYALGDNVLVGGAFGGAIYRVTQAGTTSASSPPPSGRPTSVPYTYADGTARLLWINDSAIAAKVGLYNEVKVVPGGGNSWGQANNFELAPGVIPQNLHTSLELDFSNHSGTDCVAGIANCLGLYIRMAGTNRNTSAISVEGVDASARSLFGVRLTGPLADTTIDLGTSGVTGIGIGTFTAASYSSAAISEASTAPVSLNVTGAKSLADVRLAASSPIGLSIDGTKTSSSISDTATSPAGINIAGTKSLSAIRVAATAPTAIDLSDGTYSAWQILGKGFNIDTAGNLAVPSLSETVSAPPASGTAPCSTGARRWDANYEYRCISPNKWRRTQLVDF